MVKGGVRVHSDDGVTFTAYSTATFGRLAMLIAEAPTYGGALRALETKINQKQGAR